MVVSKQVTVFWNAKIKKHYTEKGYTFTKMGDPFVVDVEDLTPGSNVRVRVKCDYCGKEYDLCWYSYLDIKRKEIVHKDACKDCGEAKAAESIELKYGGQAEKFFATNQSRVRTNYKRYGCSNPFGNEGVKEKIRATNLERYGTPYTQQCKEVREKVIKTCNERYGVNHYVELFKGKFIGENSPCWKNDATYQRAERATNEYVQWRKFVYDRDLYTCQKCGIKSGEGQSVTLNAHHICNWRDNLELRYDTNNGITLCEECHTSFHKIYGKRNNTKQQLTEFLNK